MVESDLLEDITWEDTPSQPLPRARKTLDEIVEVVDLIEGQLLGRLGNLTPEGMLIIADYDIPVGALYQVSFELGDETGDRHRFGIGVSCLWCKHYDPGCYWAGFEIIDIVEEQRERLQEIHALM